MTKLSLGNLEVTMPKKRKADVDNRNELNEIDEA